MSTQELMVLASALATIAIALVGVVWGLLIKRIEAQDLKFKDLETEQKTTRERVVVVEALSTSNKEKITEVDARRHRYQVEQRHEHTEMLKWLTETILEKLSK